MTSEWPILKIEDLAERVGMGPFGSSIKVDTFVESGVPIISGEHLHEITLTEKKFRFITEAHSVQLSKSNVFRGDVIFTHAGTIGQVSVIPEDSKYEKYALSQRQFFMRCKKNIVIPLYVAYFFRSPMGRHKLLANSSQVGVPSIARPVTYLRSIEIPVPPLAVQQEIVATIESIRDKIKFLNENNSILEAIAKTIFKSWFIDFDPVRAKQEGEKPEGMDDATAALFPNSFEQSDQGEIPTGWELCAVYDMATFINGAAYKAFEPNGEQRGLPIIKIAELKNGVTANTAYSDIDMPKKYLIDTGDILFSWSGNPDTSIDTFVWPYDAAWLNQHIFRVLPSKKNERAFVLQALRNFRPIFAELARNKQTTGLGHVTVSDLKRLLIARPQQTVLDAFEKIAGTIQKKIFYNSLQLNTLTNLRDTLLPRLISGQLRMPDVEEQIEAATA